MLRKLYLHAPCVYQVRSLLRENAECHAQIRLLGSEVVGLSEALEIVTKRAHEGEVKQAQILSQAEYVTRGAGANRQLRPASAKTRPSSAGRAAVVRGRSGTRSPAMAGAPADRDYYQPAVQRGCSPSGSQRPSSADVRRRPGSAGRGRDAVSARGREVHGGRGDPRDFQSWLEADRAGAGAGAGAHAVLGRAQQARAEAWAGAIDGSGGQLPPVSRG